MERRGRRVRRVRRSMVGGVVGCEGLVRRMSMMVMWSLSERLSLF